jgi:hypothetical protein
MTFFTSKNYHQIQLEITSFFFTAKNQKINFSNRPLLTPNFTLSKPSQKRPFSLQKITKKDRISSKIDICANTKHWLPFASPSFPFLKVD